MRFILPTPNLQFHQLHSQTQVGGGAACKAASPGPASGRPAVSLGQGGAKWQRCYSADHLAFLPADLPALHRKQATPSLPRLPMQAVFFQDFPPKQDGTSSPGSDFETSLARYLAALQLPGEEAKHAQAGWHWPVSMACTRSRAVCWDDGCLLSSAGPSVVCVCVEPLLPPCMHLQELVRRHDFSAARAVLVASVPGSHGGELAAAYGHKRLAALLGREA